MFKKETTWPPNRQGQLAAMLKTKERSIQKSKKVQIAPIFSLAGPIHNYVIFCRNLIIL